jgi:hypothetical protein
MYAPDPDDEIGLLLALLALAGFVCTVTLAIQVWA